MSEEPNYPPLSRTQVEAHLSRALNEMSCLARVLSDLPHGDGVQHSADVRRALTLGQKIVDVCRQRLKLMDNGFEVAGHPPPSLIKATLGGPDCV